MGSCASRLDVQGRDDVQSQQPGPVSGLAASSAVLNEAVAEEEKPLKVRVNERSGTMKLGRTASGRVVVEVVREDDHPPWVAEVDAAVGCGTDSPEYKALEVLEKMGFGLQFSPGDAFIGQLVLNVVEVSGLTAAAPRPYVVVSGENDKSNPKDATRVEGDAIYFEGAKFIFFVLFSNSIFEISLKAHKGPTKVVVGKAVLAVKQLKQGFERGELELVNDKGAKVGTIKVDVDYRWLRGTRDDGTYTVVNRVIVNRSRAMRKTGRVTKAALELISQVNHWLLSHDNMWRAQQDEGQEQQRKERQEGSGAAAPEEEEEGEAPQQQEGGAAASVKVEDASEVGASTSQALDDVASQADLMLPEGDAASQLQCAIHGQQEGAVHAEARITQDLLLETLGPQSGDSREVAQLKQALLVVLAPIMDRIADMDDRIKTLTQAVQQHQMDTRVVEGAAAAGVPEAQRTPSGTVTEGGGEGGGEGRSQSSQVTPFISGHFEYGMGRPASKRTVFVFMRKAHLAGSPVMHPQFLGTHKTKRNGDLGPIPMPDRVCRTPGHYEVIGMLPDDYTTAKGSMFILQPGTKAVVFDMDGTITIGDGQVVTQFSLDALGASTALNAHLSHKFDLRPRRHALHAVRAWAAKGYQPIYLSGRQGSYYNLTLAWLIKHRYPPGPIHLTRTHFPTLPLYFSVGLFKVKYLEGLKEKGIELYAAYGNTTTDIKAYEAAGVPKERLYIIGPHGGKGGSIKVANWTDHIPEVLALPDADVPIPYTELLFSERPGYYKKKNVRGADGVVRELSTVASMGVSGPNSSVGGDDYDDEDHEEEYGEETPEGGTPPIQEEDLEQGQQAQQQEDHGERGEDTPVEEGPASPGPNHSGGSLASSVGLLLPGQH